MGKDKEGKFHPLKGKPSGTRAKKGVTTTKSSTLDQQFEIEDKYTDQPDIDEMSANVRVRHPNRNVDKGAERKVPENKKNAPNKTLSESLKEESGNTSVDELAAMLSKETIQELASFNSDCSISIYLPTHRAGVEVNEQMDLIAFKNALQQVESKLKARRIEQTRITKILRPGYDLLRNEKFWYNLSDGLAAFIGDGFFKYIKLPSTTSEQLMVNTTFYLSPLVPIISTTEYFYLLVISKKKARLFRANNFGMEEVEIKELPDGVDDVVHFEEKDDQKLFRTGSSGAGQGANYHGIGAGKPDEKENITMYLEEVDETLWKELLNNENVPLVLAGVEYLLPLFKKVTHYNQVWEKNLTGNFEHIDNQQLYRQAREIMEPFFRERLNKAKESYGNQSATALTSSTAEEIIPASYYSRVSQLFVQEGVQIWGTFDEATNKIVIHNDQQDGDDSLIDKAVIKTIMNGGDVFIVKKDDMPAPGGLAAIMRY